MKAITEQKILNEQELEKFIYHLNNFKGTRDSIMLRIALRTGARSIEVLRIRPMDVGNQNVTIYGVKSSNDRTIPLPKDLFDELKTYIKEESIPANEYVFKMTTRHYRRIFKQFCPNVYKSSKSMRHTFGVKLYQNCKEIIPVKAALGHRQINNTMVYLEYVELQDTLKDKMKGMFE